MPASLDDRLARAVDEVRHAHRYRELSVSRRLDGPYIERDGRRYLSFSCNDYLGLARHPQIMAAAEAALHAHGCGSGASRLITGNHPMYDALEKALADYHHTEAALVFGSGYLANLGVIGSVMTKNDLILADKYSHACMLDGTQLSGAALKRFSHNDMAHLEQLLEQHREQYDRCLLMTESVFSMDGDIAPLAALSALAKRYDAWLLVDNAHGLDIACKEADIWIGTLSKAFGSYGGYVCGSRTLRDYLVNHARSFIFTTGLPPSVVAAALAAVNYVKEHPDICRLPLQHTQACAEALELPTPHSQILPLMVGESERAVQLSQCLQEKGILVPAIRPPTVPAGTARLRLSFQANHTQAHVDQLVAALKRHKELWDENHHLQRMDPAA